MVWVGGDLKGHVIPPPAIGRDTFHYPMVLRALSSLALDTSGDPEAATAALGNLWQGLTTLMGRASSQYPI